jgi:hypothetical protein
MLARTDFVELPEIRSRCSARDGHCGVSVYCAIVICVWVRLRCSPVRLTLRGWKWDGVCVARAGQNAILNSLALELIIGSAQKIKRTYIL